MSSCRYHSAAMEELFREARLKVERAKHHIDNLNLIYAEFTKRKTHQVFIEHDSHGGDDVLKVKAVESLPPDFVLTLGDAIHNLRTSLDYVMNEIEFLKTTKRSDYTKFPIYKSRTDLINAINGGLKKKAPEQVIDCIVDGIQPYTGGDGEFLCHLHDLDIEDKHRLLIAKAEFSFVDGITVEDDAGSEFTFGTWLVVYGKIADVPLAGNRNAKVKNEGQPSYSVRFGNALPFALEPVIPTMNQLAVLLGGTIDEIEYWFRRSQIGI